MPGGSTPRHAQTAGDLGLAVQCNLMLAHCVFSLSFAILVLHSSQSNNKSKIRAALAPLSRNRFTTLAIQPKITAKY